MLWEYGCSGIALLHFRASEFQKEPTRLWCCVAASPGYRSPGRRDVVEPSTWKTASLVTNPWGGGQPQGNESDAGQDRPVSREERVGHRQCPRWSGYARQTAIVGTAEVVLHVTISIFLPLFFFDLRLYHTLKGCSRGSRGSPRTGDEHPRQRGFGGFSKSAKRVFPVKY